MPVIQFRIRTLMIVTAIAAMSLWLVPWFSFTRMAARQIERELLASDHEFREIQCRRDPVGGVLLSPELLDIRKAGYHAALKRNYHFGAEHPWIPLWPDGPEPMPPALMPGYVRLVMLIVFFSALVLSLAGAYGRWVQRTQARGAEDPCDSTSEIRFDPPTRG